MVSFPYQCTKVQSPQRNHVGYTIMLMHAIHKKMANRTYVFNGGLCRGVVQRKPHIFWPLLPTVYIVVFLGQTDAPKVRCDLTDIHRDRDNYSNPPAHACQELHVIIHSPLLKIHVGGQAWKCNALVGCVSRRQCS